jgi:hypothetical protein
MRIDAGNITNWLIAVCVALLVSSNTYEDYQFFWFMHDVYVTSSAKNMTHCIVLFENGNNIAVAPTKWAVLLGNEVKVTRYST